MLHYYFRDKVDLLMHCVREYKAVCVTRYDEVVATAATAEELEQGFLDKLAQTLVEESHLHRLWYDLRSQSMFEPSFRADVAAIDLSLERMIWRVVERAAAADRGAPRALAPPVMYAVFDGLFQQALLRQLAGDAGRGGRPARRDPGGPGPGAPARLSRPDSVDLGPGQRQGPPGGPATPSGRRGGATSGSVSGRSPG